MSNKNGKTVDNEQRTDTIVGIVTVAVVLALFVWLFVSMSMRGNAISNVAFDGEVRRGQEQVFTADVKSSKIKDGETVKWIVNGETVAEDVYKTGEPLKLNYAPTKSGMNYLTVQIGKYNKTAFVEVMPPQLTVSAPNIVITYGDELPDLTYDCQGFIDEDCREMLDYNGICYLCDDNCERLNCDKLDVGVYKLSMEEDCCFKDYQVNYVGGTLTVLPKTLSTAGYFVKTYDGCNTIENPQICLKGVKAGDDVTTKCDKLYFDNKNAGNNKAVMLANVELVGKDAHNYVLESAAQGAILPKQVEISGLVIRDKMYDGTTRAQIDKMGNICGIVEGDSVAIGNLELSFEQADAGEQPIKLDNVTLIGADKDNYEIIGIDVENATINTTIWNKIFIKNPAIVAGA